MQHSLVSIVIPCFNAERWIVETIQSALRQSWSETEVIVVDDGSTDGTRSLVEGFGSSVRAEFHANQGPSAARNRGIGLARGRWIQFLDADDLLLPGCVEDKLSAQSPDPRAVVCCSIEYLEFTSQRGEAAGPECWKKPRHDLDIMLESGGPQTGAPLLAVEDLRSLGGFRESLRCGEEFDLFLRMAIELDRKFESHGKTGLQIRPHAASISRSAGARMDLARGEVLLHAADLLRSRGLLTAARRISIAQRAGLFARQAALRGQRKQAEAIAARARHLSASWHRRAYKFGRSGLLVRLLGFSLYERLQAAAGRRSSVV